MSNNIRTAVLHSTGPDKDPFSMYATSNAVHHDLKIPLSNAPARKPDQGMGGFARNNLPTTAKEVPDVPNPRTLGRKFNRLIDDAAAPVHAQSVSAAAYSMSATTLGERAGHVETEEDADWAASIALHRAKRAKSGFMMNSTMPPTHAIEDPYAKAPSERTALAKAKLSRTDPLARENGFDGPAPMSTTSKASYVRPPDMDPDLEDEDAYLDLTQRRVAVNGSVKNRAATLFHRPHDGWNPSTESRDNYKKHVQPTDPDSIMSPSNLKSGRRQPTANLRAIESTVAHVPPESDSLGKLTYLQEQKLRNADPIQYDVLKRNDPWATTNRAVYSAPADANKTALIDVLDTNSTARRLVGTVDDKSILVKTLGGAPHKPPASGFATNNKGVPGFERMACTNPSKLSVQQASTCRVARRLDHEGDIMSSIYKADFRNQMKLPPPQQQFHELKKHCSGFDRANRDNMFNTNEDDPDRWRRKV